MLVQKGKEMWAEEITAFRRKLLTVLAFGFVVGFPSVFLVPSECSLRFR